VSPTTTSTPAARPASVARDQLTKGAQTRRAILDAAIVRFGREGYRATSVADIARDASVSGTAAYAYFDGKEDLFLAAVDEDAAAAISEGMAGILDEKGERSDWRESLMFTMLDAVERRPLARRLLAGHEPEVTERVLETPALNDLRRAVAERLSQEQAEGTVRPDIDPVPIANGVVMILLSLLRSVIQIGAPVVDTYGADVAAVFAAALDVQAG
jgi:AcrR family transcriptional regulator